MRRLNGGRADARGQVCGCPCPAFDCTRCVRLAVHGTGGRLILAGAVRACRVGSLARLHTVRAAALARGGRPLILAAAGWACRVGSFARLRTVRPLSRPFARCVWHATLGMYWDVHCGARWAGPLCLPRRLLVMLLLVFGRLFYGGHQHVRDLPAPTCG